MRNRLGLSLSNVNRIAISLVLMAILLQISIAPAWAQQPITRIRNAVITTLSVPGAATVEDLAVDEFILTAQTAATITNNGTLAPTGAFQPITAAGAVGTSGANITVGAAGSVLVLLNVGSNTITFTETGTLVSAGNIALGAGDSAVLISNGTNYYAIGGSNN